jgi:hypothetical protein
MGWQSADRRQDRRWMSSASRGRPADDSERPVVTSLTVLDRMAEYRRVDGHRSPRFGWQVGLGHGRTISRELIWHGEWLNNLSGSARISPGQPRWSWRRGGGWKWMQVSHAGECLAVPSSGPSPKLGRGLLVLRGMARIDSRICLSSLSGKVPTE